MHVAFVASEGVPFSKTGGLADVVGALPRALAAQGHQITVYLPRYRHTKLTGCGVDFDATRSRWEGFLADTFGGDDELIDYMQKLAGLAAIGEVLHHILPFAFDTGANGTGVFLDVLTEVLHDDLAKLVYDRLKRRPMVLPVVVEV